MKSLASRFILGSLLVAILVFAAAEYLTYRYARSVIEREIDSKVTLITQNTHCRITHLLTIIQERCERTANRLIIKDFDRNASGEILRQTLKKNPTFYGMALALDPARYGPFSPYYFKKDRGIVYRDLASPEYDYATKPWFTRPKVQRCPVWSEPYFDKYGGEVLMTTFSDPIFDQKGFVGVVTADLSLAELQRIVTSIKILKTGYAFLLSRDNRLIAHPDMHRLMQPYTMFRGLETGKMIKHADNWYYFIPIEETGWQLGIVMPVSELFAPLKTLMLILAVIALAGMLLLLVIQVVITRRITRPLEALTQMSERVSRGEFEQSLVLPSGKDEVYRLAYAFERMRASLVHYISDLKQATEKEVRSRSELQLAQTIQQSMLGRSRVEMPEVQVQAFLRPAKMVAGDFYDLFFLDEERLFFVIADVSGKGIAAALYMSRTLSYLRAYAESGLSLKQMTEKLNNLLARHNDASMFVTLICGTLHIKTGEVVYIDAGHPLPYLLRSTGSVERLTAPVDPVVGAFEEIDFTPAKIRLHPGETLLLFTDGVNEAFSLQGEAFGYERLEALLKEVPSESSPEEIGDALLQKIEMFEEGRGESSDDVTLLVIRFLNLDL